MLPAGTRRIGSLGGTQGVAHMEYLERAEEKILQKLVYTYRRDWRLQGEVRLHEAAALEPLEA
ncbi:hypothetical protein DV515_00014042 [Chloebia gouldiae]|uniref:Uncharacterized protein n=1 Tax=Chloebia gouldiae TaxID=44316 RepID=A0A3L8RZ73_CHLGU|nr:hypothetical protein DV515_00014042 [Chloebia gouldiae]